MYHVSRITDLPCLVCKVFGFSCKKSFFLLKKKVDFIFAIYLLLTLLYTYFTLSLLYFISKIGGKDGVLRGLAGLF